MMLSTQSGGVYHAAQPRQAAPLSLTRLSLRGQKKADRVERQKTGACFACKEETLAHLPPVDRSCSTRRMLASGLFKDRRLIRLSFEPDGKENAYPHVGQSAHSDRMALALDTFALVIVSGPRFPACTRPAQTAAGHGARV